MNIGIVGLGLIGGSLGLRLQKLNHIVYGFTNNIYNKEKAKERKLANFISCDLEMLKKCSIIILALPIKDLVNPSEELINAIPKDSLVTDVGSIKVPIIKTWEKIHPLFVGSHPMAGTEEKGVLAGNEGLLENAKWIITPTLKTNTNSINELSRLVNSMQCEIFVTSPNEHDEAVSLISHLPIFVASSLIDTANIETNESLLHLVQKLASTGFADTSRVGGGNPDLALDLAINNQANILNSLNIFKKRINDFETIIREKNWELLHEKLLRIKMIRSNFLK